MQEKGLSRNLSLPGEIPDSNLNLFTAYLKFGRLCKAVKMLTLNIMQIYEE